MTKLDEDLEMDELVTRDLGPAPDECLYCYLNRTLTHVACPNELEWTRRWCDAQRFDTSWVTWWLRDNGGYCDCEVLANVFRDNLRARRHRELRCQLSYPAFRDAYSER